MSSPRRAPELVADVVGSAVVRLDAGLVRLTGRADGGRWARLVVADPWEPGVWNEVSPPFFVRGSTPIRKLVADAIQLYGARAADVRARGAEEDPLTVHVDENDPLFAGRRA